MLLTVILPTYNVEKYLRECLDSVLNQTFRNLEVIIMDDNSSDSTPEIIKEYAAQDARIKTVFHKANKGPGKTRNEGLELATGDYVTLMDHDDWQDLTKYEKLMAKAKEYDADFVACNAHEFRQDQNKCIAKVWGNNMKNVDTSKPIPMNTWAEKSVFINSHTPPWAKIVKRSLIEKHNIRFGSRQLFDDVLFHYHLCMVSKTAAYVPEVLYTHRYMPASISGQWREKGDVNVKDSLMTWQDLEAICAQDKIDPAEVFKFYMKKLAKYAYRAEHTAKYVKEIRKIIEKYDLKEADFPRQYRIYYKNVMHYSGLRKFIICTLRRTKLRLRVLLGK